MEEYIIAGIGLIAPFWILSNVKTRIEKKCICVILNNPNNISGKIWAYNLSLAKDFFPYLGI